MSKEKDQLLSDEFLEEVAREINQLCRGTANEQSELLGNSDVQ